MKLLKGNLLLIFFILLGILWKALKWEMIPFFSLFSYPSVNIAVWAVLLIALALLILLPAFKKGAARGLVPLILCALFLLPFDRVYEQLRFFTLRPDMELSASVVLADYAREGGSSAYNIPLTGGKEHLSRFGGYVDYYGGEDGRRMVFFYTFRGVGTSNGYYYLEAPVTPGEVTPALFGPDCTKTQYQSAHWVYAEFA